MAKKRQKAYEPREVTELDLQAGRNIRYHFLDSGAFSLRFLAEKWHKLTGLPIEDYYDSQAHFDYLDAYADFVKKYAPAVDLFANVDVMGDSERSYRNQLYLEKLGVKPVPVVHFLDEISVMERYLERGYKYIGLGGLAKMTGSPICQDWLDKMFDFLCDTPDRTPKVKIHGFGVGGFRWLFRYPWYSVDSTSWMKNAAYGAIMVPKTERSRTEPERWEFEHEGWFYTYRYDITSELVDMTHATLKSMTGNHYKHMEKLNWLRALRITKWLEFIDMPFGETEVNEEDPKETKIIVEGVSNSGEMRNLANVKYYMEVMKSIPPYPQPFKYRPRRSFGLL